MKFDALDKIERKKNNKMIKLNDPSDIISRTNEKCILTYIQLRDKILKIWNNKFCFRDSQNEFVTRQRKIRSSTINI